MRVGGRCCVDTVVGQVKVMLRLPPRADNEMVMTCTGQGKILLCIHLLGKLLSTWVTRVMSDLALL